MIWIYLIWKFPICQILKLQINVWPGLLLAKFPGSFPEVSRLATSFPILVSGEPHNRSAYPTHDSFFAEAFTILLSLKDNSSLEMT